MFLPRMEFAGSRSNEFIMFISCNLVLPFYPPIICVWASDCSTFLSTLVIISVLKLYYYCVFHSISLITHYLEYSFMYLLAICIFSMVKILTILKIGLVCLLLSFLNSFYVGIQDICHLYALWMFSPSLWLAFYHCRVEVLMSQNYFFLL